MRSAFLVISFVPWLYGAAMLAPHESLKYVEKMLKYGNAEMSRRKLEVLWFQDRDWNFFIGDLRLWNIRLGNMSTLALIGPVEDQKFVLRNASNSTVDKVYDFDLKVGLREMRAKLDYRLETLGWGDVGGLAVVGRQNALSLRGSLTLRRDKWCVAQLDFLRLGVFSGVSEVELWPESWGRRVTCLAARWAVQHGLPVYQDLLDQALRAYLLHNELFTAYLNEFMCYPFVVG